MRRRGLLCALAGAVGLAGCGGATEEPASTEAATPAPVPTEEPTPVESPPADLSALGVADGRELARAHRETLVGGPHGFRRRAAVREDGELVRSVEVTIRASAGSAKFYFSFEATDTPRYPTAPLEPFFETWYDGTTYQRFGGGDDYFVTTDRTFDSPRNATTDRFRIQRLFEAFSALEVTETGGEATLEATATGLRVGYDVTPRRLRVLSDPRGARLEATVGTDPRFVTRYDLSTAAAIDRRPVDVRATVDFDRLEEPPTEPGWVESAREQAER